MLSRPRAILAGKVLLDVLVLVAAFCAAYVCRFEGSVPEAYAHSLWVHLPFVLAVKFAILAGTGRLRMTWRYTGLREAVRIFTALAAAAILLLLWSQLRYAIPAAVLGDRPYPVPVGVVVLDLTLGFLGMTGIRAIARIQCEKWDQPSSGKGGPGRIPTLLIGAGRAGAMVARDILARPGAGLQLVGFLDDDPGLHGLRVEGVPVLGGMAALPAVAHRFRVRQVIITIASASQQAIRRIVGLCEASKLPTKIVPALHEIVEGRITLAKVREVSVEDLLRRSPVRLDFDAVREHVRNQVVLVTGAGGSIGSELCRTIVRLAPATLVLVDQAENSLFQIHSALQETASGVRLVPCIADVCDETRMDSIFAEHRPRFAFHAAAHKHVPMMEWNPGEAVKNNVLGTRTVAALADAWQVEWFVMISTDKAVNPASVMGVSKRVAELFIQSLGRTSGTRFMTVRFGNVLGSAGSVIPIFQRQIASGGPVTVTHPEMTRYFMTIPEACQLVLQAAGMGKGGELFILDMGEPVKIVDLARDLIRLSGFCPDRDVEIRYTGLRPGEKLCEELSHGEEEVLKTGHPRIFVGKVKAPELCWISRMIDDLAALAVHSDVARICAKFKEIVPEYQYAAVRADPGSAPPVKAMHRDAVPSPLPGAGGLVLGNDPA
jgi:FlaA1/EpsC-like NDP-sugar epimerase